MQPLHSCDEQYSYSMKQICDFGLARIVAPSTVTSTGEVPDDDVEMKVPPKSMSSPPPVSHFR
jgi:hypothetical protein